MRRRRILLALAGLGVMAAALGGPGTVAGATNPHLAKNSHGRLDNGKGLPHVSGGTEVSFDQERAEAADAQAGTADDPPAGVASSLGCRNRGSATNPRVNQDCTARRQAEEQVAVNPIDPTNVIAGQNDSRIGFNHCGFDYSLDGSSTWGDGLPPFWQHLNPFTGHTYDAASDPTVTFDGNGKPWFSCVVFDINSDASGLFVVPSTPALKGSAYANIGAGASAFVVAETADGHTFYDKEFIAGDQRPGHTEVYVTFSRFLSDQKCSTGNNPGAYCSSEIFYSKWTGSAWSPITSISGNAPFCVGGNTFDKKAAANACNFNQGSMPVVLPNGDVFVAWNNGNTPTFVNQTLGRRIHPDGTLGPVVRIGSDDESNIALCDFGRGPEECVQSLNVRTNDFPAIALDPTNTNHLVAVWQDSRHSSPNAGNYDVVVSESFDGGTTWTDNTSGGGTVLDPPPGGAYFEPSVAITKTGKIAASFYLANPYSGAPGGGTFTYGLRSKSAGAFSAFVQLADGSANPSPQTNPTQQGFLGDYSSIAASSAAGSDTVYAVWSDTRNASAAQGPDEDIFIATYNVP